MSARACPRVWRGVAGRQSGARTGRQIVEGGTTRCCAWRAGFPRSRAPGLQPGSGHLRFSPAPLTLTVTTSFPDQRKEREIMSRRKWFYMTAALVVLLALVGVGGAANAYFPASV